MSSDNYIAVAIKQVSGVKSFNPYFWSHLTRIAPEKTIVVSLRSYDEGLSEITGPKIQVKGTNYKSMPFFIKRARFIWNVFATGYYNPIPVGELKKISGIFKQYNVKSVLAEEGPVGCAIQPLCDIANIQLFVHFHGYDATALAQLWHIRHSYRRLASKAEGIISTSNYLAKKLEELGFKKERLHVVPCGVDTEAFKPDTTNRDENLIIAVGRFIPKKAPYHTVSAFGKAVKIIPDLRLEMIGDGPLLQLCKKKAFDLGIEKKVKFKSENCSNEYVRKKMQKASIFCQHSVVAPNKDTESFGITLVEAMACGVPVVATRHNGFIETVIEGETGFLVDEHDVDGMANAIIKLARDSDLRKSMGEACRKRAVVNYSSELNILRLRRLLNVSH